MNRNRITPPPKVLELMELLEAAGEECWIVGGCVRDSLMGKTPHDWDMTTSASTAKMKEIFAQKRLILNGEQHGTVGVIEDGEVYEITTFRIESGCSDHRHPDKILFTREIREDLSRRDFTVNAMAYHPQRGLLDCFGGEEDIENQVIRCVGEPKRRFEEDTLRILRAVRFGAVLGFELDEETKQAAEQQAHLLREISAERIYTELSKALCGKWVDRTFGLKKVWQEVLPELEYLKHLPDTLPEDAPLRLICLYHSAGKRADEPIRRLKMPKAALVQEEALWEIKQSSPKTVMDFRRILNRFGEGAILDYLALTVVEDRSMEKELREIVHRAKKGCWKVSQLNINGKILLEQGCPGGKRVGEILSQLLEECMSDQLANERETLICRARELF